MMAMNGSYGGGALVFLFFNYLYYHHGLSLKELFIGYSILAGCLLVMIIAIWPLKKYELPEEERDPQISINQTPHTEEM